MAKTTATRRAGKVKLAIFALASAGVLSLTVGPLARAIDLTKVGQPRTAQLAELGFKFQGANACSAAKCHGATEEMEERPGNENVTWSEQDAHAVAFETLENDESKAIAQKLNISDATTSERCTNCHTLGVAENLRGEDFSIEEGVSCNACHGPSEKWLEPHKEAGWAENLRKTMSTEQILKTHGLYDTKPPIARAEICTSCHLAIDADLVAAGHPQPVFELDSYSVLEPPHWRDPEGYFSTKIWAAGQVVSLRDAMAQLAKRAQAGNVSDELLKDSAQQALSHLLMVKELVQSKAIQGDVAALDQQQQALTTALGANDKAALAAAGSATADVAQSLIQQVQAFDPDGNKDVTKGLLNAIASNQNVAQAAGNFGMEQQAMAIAALYNSYAEANKVGEADLDAVNNLINAKLYPAEEGGELSAEQFNQGLQEVKAKLPQ